MLLKNLRILGEDYSFYNGGIHVSDGVFSESSSGDTIDCTGLTMLPGLVDIHTHGAVGYDNMDDSYAAINGISHFMAKKAGVTTYLPTLITNSRENMIKAAANIADAKKQGVCGAKIGGIYMEGPYFSEKYKGAQNPDFLRCPDCGEFEEIYKASDGLIKAVSIAPEQNGSEAFIKQVSGLCAVAVGHTDSDYDTAYKAFNCGASILTHTFNAMRGIHHRNPNAICAALDSGAYCELICDGMHIHPSVIRMFFKACAKNRIVMISDSLRATGLADGEYELGGQTTIVKDGKATLADGTIAGSTTPLFEDVRRAVSFGIPLENAVMAASLNPAKAAGLSAGIIKCGAPADFLLVDSELNLVSTYVDGVLIN